MFKRVVSLLSIIIVSLYSREYSLTELLDSTYKHSDILKIAEYEMDKNREKIKEKKVGFLPKVTLTGDYNYTPSPEHLFTEYSKLKDVSYTQSYLNNVIFPDSRDYFLAEMMDETVNRLGRGAPKNRVSFSANIEQTIWSQGRIANDFRIASIEGRSLICNWQDMRMKVKSEVTRLYYRSLLAEENLNINRQFLELLKNRHSLTKSYFLGEMRTELDTLNSFLDLSSAKTDLNRTIRERDDIIRTLLTLAKIDENVDSVKISGKLTIEPFDKTYEKAEEQLIENNKTLTRLRAKLDIAEFNVLVQKGQYSPLVKGGVKLDGASYFGDNSPISLIPFVQFYLGFNYEILSFGKRRSQLEQAKYSSRIIERELTAAEDRLKLQLKNQFQLLNEKKARVDQSEIIISTAKKAYEIAMVSFSSGIISSLDLESSENKYLKSLLNNSQSIYEYNSELINLRVIIADYLYDTQ